MLLIAGYALLTAAWLIGNPPFASPDESLHYVRALTVARGELVGEPAEITGIPSDQAAWVNQAARAVVVPAGLSPDGYGCFFFQPEVPASCQDEVETAQTPREEVIANGTYQPSTYFVPGVFTFFGDDPEVANRLGRVGSALVSIGLLALATFMLWRTDRNGAALIGLAVAITPMVIFVSSVLTPSGPEIAASIALVVALLHLHDTPPRMVWVSLGLSGAILVLSRSLGPLWLALYGLVFLLWYGPRRLRELGREPKVWVPPLTAIGLAAVFNRWWEYRYGPDVEVAIESFDDVLAALAQVPEMVRQHIGVFGHLEVAIPRLAYLTWHLMLGALVLLAMVVATRRQRWAMSTIIVFAIAAPVLLDSAVLVHTGFGVQGRHVLAMGVGVPLMCGHALFANRTRLLGVWSRRPLLWFALPTSLVHFVGWYANARRNAVGSEGPLFFIGDAPWAPPLGWWPWLILAALGSVAILLAGYLARDEVGGSPETPEPDDSGPDGPK